VFASIQSLAQVDLTQLDPSAFDVVIVDEFHHAAAPTYRRLLEHLFAAKDAEPTQPPRILLGLTATPERTDAEDILHYFDNRIALSRASVPDRDRYCVCRVLRSDD
jgi:superfamily II DNA or RNA helicase